MIAPNELIQGGKLTRNQFLKLNEKKFGNLLKRLRKNISIPKRPEDFDGQYKSSVQSSVNDFTDDYEELMKSQTEDMAEVTTSRLSSLGEKFIIPAAAVLGGAVIKAGNPVDGIPAAIAESWMSRTLPNGFTLSERVWDLRNYSNDILQTVNNGILNNLNPEMLSKALDGFLLPGRETTTLTPYGRSLGFDAMRLARNEVVQSGRQASKDALTNCPWVTGLLFDASDGCEELCKPEQGIYTDEASLPDPHPHCNCPVIEQVMSSEEWDAALSDYTTNGTDDAGISEWLGDEGALAGTPELLLREDISAEVPTGSEGHECPFLDKELSGANSIVEHSYHIKDLPYENGYLFDENGRAIAWADGAEKTVTGTKDIANPDFLDGTFVHNHPGGQPFSPEDVQFAASKNLNELHIVTSKERMVLARSESGWSNEIVTTENFKNRYFDLHAELWANEIMTGNMSLAEFKDTILTRLGEEFGFSYARGPVWSI